MIRTIGQELESSKAAGAKQRMDVYFGRIQALSKSPKLESRVRFGLTVRIRSQREGSEGNCASGLYTLSLAVVIERSEILI